MSYIPTTEESIEMTLQDLGQYMHYLIEQERKRCARLCLRPEGWLTPDQQKLANEIRINIEKGL